MPTADITTKLKNAATANDLPALARVTGLDPLWVNQLQDLSDIAKSHGIDEKYLQESPDGIIPAIPSDLTAVGLFVNKSLFDKAGVDIPHRHRGHLDLGRVHCRRHRGPRKGRRQVRRCHGPLRATASAP